MKCAIDSLRKNNKETLSTISATIDETLDREKRKNNIVIFGIEESYNKSCEKAIVENLLSTIACHESEIISQTRLGQLNKSTPRPILIKVNEEMGNT